MHHNPDFLEIQKSKMLINLSNHSSTRWSTAQIQTAVQLFGETHDLPFPNISPDADLHNVFSLAEEYVQKCHVLIQERLAIGENPGHAIHVMGEMTFVYQFVKLAAAAGLRCVASTTERIAVDHPDGSKTSEFRFVRFRDYESLR